MLNNQNSKIMVIIPTYKSGETINTVISAFLPKCDCVIVVDDACPENSTAKIEPSLAKNIEIIHNEKNLGVGGAVKKGFEKALSLGADIIVKVDSDGQMNPAYFEALIAPLKATEVQFSKGNRFYSMSDLKGMPLIRLLGNSCLSFINKLVSGYWGVMDPTNGYIAINAKCLKDIGFEKLDNRYFFESDVLCQLGLHRVSISELPMTANYGDENSNMSIPWILLSFPGKYLKRLFKRIFYVYFLRDINPGSISLLLGITLVTFGSVFGAYKWIEGLLKAEAVTSGTVMLAALPIILGTQFLLYFLQYDVERGSKLVIKNRW